MEKTLDKLPILYKYRAFNGAAMSCLIRNVVWFASPATFNDPFDGWLALPKQTENSTPVEFDLSSPKANFTQIPQITPRDDESSRSAISRLNYNFPEFQEHTAKEQKLKHRGLFCTTENPKNILMWSHYADEHKGMCIGYEFNYEKLAEIAFIRKVIYPESDDLDVLTDDDLTDSGQSFDKLLIKKSRLWAYEGEWRFILKRNLLEREEGCEQTLLELGTVREIIFGMRMRADHRDTIAKIVPKNVELKVAHAAYRRYQVNVFGYQGK